MATPVRSSLRYQIADVLRERLLGGEFEAGEQLPSEPELARSLGVSRSSLRAAIALLEAEGLLRRRHGSGTYVTERPLLRNDLSLNFGVAEMIASTGLEHSTSYSHAAGEGRSATRIRDRRPGGGRRRRVAGHLRAGRHGRRHRRPHELCAA